MAVISCCSSGSRSMPFCREASHNYKSPSLSTIICSSRKSSTQLHSDCDSHSHFIHSPPRLPEPPSFSTSSIRWRGMGVAAAMVLVVVVVQKEGAGAEYLYEDKGWATEISGRLLMEEEGETEEGVEKKNLSSLRKPSRRKSGGGGCPQWRRSQLELILPEIKGLQQHRLPNFRAASSSSSETGHPHLHNRPNSNPNHNCFSL